MADPKKYPVYLYHKNEQDPVLVTNRDDEQALSNKGWTRAYLHKDYPKYVNGVIVKSKAEHEALLAQPQMKVSTGPLPEEAEHEALLAQPQMKVSTGPLPEEAAQPRGRGR